MKNIKDSLHTLRDFIRYSLSQFGEKNIYLGHGTDNSWDEAVHLVLAAVHLPWDTNQAVLDSKLIDAEKERILDFIQQRVELRRPLAYITNEAWFCQLPFYVDQRVIIPRSPIAELIERQFSPWFVNPDVPLILDLCAGSGCIGIACAYAFEEAYVDLVDISDSVLEVAQINIDKHELGERVQAIQSDLFSELDNKKYGLIVSNPPYVNAEDLSSMPEEYKHEPALALGSGADGLDITKRILQQAADYLTEDGILIVEVGNTEVNLTCQYPDLPIIWLELENGGNGVFVISCKSLQQYNF